MKSNSEKILTIDEYILRIDNLLPYPTSIKKIALEDLRQDVIDAMQDSSNPDPITVFGDPIKIAKDVSQSKEWHTNRAGYWVRGWAYIIDFILSIMITISFGITGILGLFLIGELSDWLYYNYGMNTIPGLILAFSVLIFFFGLGVVSAVGYFIVFEGIYSTTPGKKIFGLTVCDISGIRISWNQAITRNVSKFNSQFLFFDVIVGKFVQKTDFQRILDVVAETIVIRVR